MFGQKKKLVMCQNCRALVDPSQKTCPMCGDESVPEIRVNVSSDSRIFFSMLILAVNVLLFVLMGAAAIKSGVPISSFIMRPPIPILIDFGSIYTPLVKQGQLWRLVTANFLHIGIIHLLFNSYALSQIGPLVEEIYGEQKFIFIYVLTGILSCVGSYYFGIGGAGASGALFGLMGILAVYGYRLGGQQGKAIMRSMLTWAGINILIGFAPGINNVAHIGGFLAGGALGFLISSQHPTMARSANVWNLLAVISVLLIVISFTMVAKNYGSVQQQAVKEQEATSKGELVIRLYKAVKDATIALDDAEAITDKSNLADVAKNLRRNATDIANIGQIDERSNEVRQRLVALINKRADKLEKAVKTPSLSPAASAEEVAEYSAVFKDYQEWQDSVLEKYGLTYTNEK
jgi:rhomboid protease GluP